VGEGKAAFAAGMDCVEGWRVMGGRVVGVVVAVVRTNLLEYFVS
jgi:hypothetical protein